MSHSTKSLFRYFKGKTGLLIILTGLLSTVSLAVLNRTLAESSRPKLGQYDKNFSKDYKFTKDLSVGSFPISDTTFSLTPLRKGQSVPRNGLVAAQFTVIPSAYRQNVSAWIPPQNQSREKPETPLYYDTVSVIRYSGSGHSVYITTVQMSPEVMRLPLDESIVSKDRLSNGKLFLATAACDGKFASKEGIPGVFSCSESSTVPNQVAFQDRDYIITVASDLPLSQVKKMAEAVVLR